MGVSDVGLVQTLVQDNIQFFETEREEERK